jgi:hypothetical protein
MPEAELHILKARMLEGRRAKARRGELGKTLPMGYLRRPSGEITLDPDEQAQGTIRLVFEQFDRFRTVGKVMRYLVDHNIRMPVRVRSGLRKGELEWHRVNRISLHDLFSNPTYAGAYVYGRRRLDPRRHKPGRPGTGRRSSPPEEAQVFLPDRLPAYISWEQYRRNQVQRQSNKPAATGIARSGQALLSRLLICGRCGLRMMAQYNNNGANPRYVCMRMAYDYCEPVCQTLKAAQLDDLVGHLVLTALQPASLEMSLLAAGELERERTTLDAQWRHRIERASYQAERARRQFDAIEPENRLVPRTLERQWEQALVEQAQLEADYERFQRNEPWNRTAAEVAAIRELASDMPGLWSAATQEERKTLVRLLLERVLVEVVNGTEQVKVTCHWHGDHRTTHPLVRPIARRDRHSTSGSVHIVACSPVLPNCVAQGRTTRQLRRLSTKRAGGQPSDVTRSSVDDATPSPQDGLDMPRNQRTPVALERRSNEWTIAELARHLPVPEPTLYSRVQKGRLPSRTVRVGGRQLLLHVDEAAVAALRAVRRTPPPWRRLPPPITTASELARVAMSGRYR